MAAIISLTLSLSGCGQSNVFAPDSDSITSLNWNEWDVYYAWDTFQNSEEPGKSLIQQMSKGLRDARPIAKDPYTNYIGESWRITLDLKNGYMLWIDPAPANFSATSWFRITYLKINDKHPRSTYIIDDKHELEAVIKRLMGMKMPDS